MVSVVGMQHGHWGWEQCPGRFKLSSRLRTTVLKRERYSSFLREEDMQTSKPVKRHKTIQNEHARWRSQHRNVAGHLEAPPWGGGQGGVF